VDLSPLLRKESWSLRKESYVRSLTQRNTRWSVAHIAKALANHPMVKQGSKFAVNAEASGGLRKKGIKNEREISPSLSISSAT
jgi:hypothetical protein